MAEIRIEKEEKSPIWPWLLGLLLLIIGATVFFLNDDDDNVDYISDNDTRIEENTTRNTVNVADNTYNQSVKLKGDVAEKLTAFTTFIERPDEDMNLDHDYTRKALSLLSASLTAMADRYDLEDVNLQSAKNVMNAKVAVLDNDPYSGKHADHIREAFMSATAVMEKIQTKRLPDMADEVRKVNEEAKELNPEVLTLDQKNAVKSFFNHFAATLEKMADKLEAQRVG